MPPAVSGSVPVVSALVEVAYIAPPEENELRFVPPLVVGRTPDTPVVSGSPVPYVRVTADGVPRSGVTSAGELLSTTGNFALADVLVNDLTELGFNELTKNCKNISKNQMVIVLS